MTREAETPSLLLHDAGRGGWLRFRRPLAVYVARDLAEVLPALQAVEREVEAGRHAAGFVAYEAAPAFDPALAARPAGRFPLLWFGIFAPPEPCRLPPPPPGAPPAIPWAPSVSEAGHRAAVARIRECIQAGETYQVNFTLRLTAPFPEAPWPFFLRMIHAQGAGYGAFLQVEGWTVCSASPELFFRLDGPRLTSRPMKGTAPRGLWPAEDRRQASRLRRSPKDRAENVMIADMVRSDLGRIAEVGTVRAPRLFAVERYPTLWQMTSTVACTTRAGIPDIFRALFPPASITGAPRARTSQIIAELETTPRRIYTGAIGFLAPGRTGQFSVAIRTLLHDPVDGTAEYGVGGGIVWDSEPEAEWRECRAKAGILTHAPPAFALLETFAWTPGEGYLLLEGHLARLATSADYFDRPLDLGAIRNRLAALAGSLPARPHRIRLLVDPDGSPTLQAEPLAPLPHPYRVRLASRPVDSRYPLLYHKTSHRDVYQEARAGAGDCADLLLWNQRGELTESTIASLVVELDGRRITPPVSSGLLPGVFRAHLLDQGTVTEAVIRVPDLARASRVCLANAVRGLWEIDLDPALPDLGAPPLDACLSTS